MFNIYTTKDNYNHINNILINDKEFSKDFNKYKNNDIFGIKYKDGYNRTNDSNLSDVIVNKYKNDKNIFMNNNSDNDLFNVRTKASADLSGDTDIIVRTLKQPTCSKVEIGNDGNIEFVIEKELGVEIVGETKMKIAIEEDEEPWDVVDDEVTDEDLNEIDNNVNEDYIK